MDRGFTAPLLPISWRAARLILFAAASAGIIIWTAVAIWWRPCRQAAGFTLIGSPGCPSVVEDAAVLAVALGFWVMGILAYCLGQKEAPIDAFFLGAATVATGKLSAMNSDVGGRLFYLLLAWLSPLVLAFHLAVLARPVKDREKALVQLLALLAALLSLPALFYSVARLVIQPWWPVWRLSVRLVLVLSLILAARLLVRDYRSGGSFAARRRTRLIGFGALSAVIPLVFLSLVPESLGAPSRVPYPVSMLFLSILPLSYGYSLLHQRLATVEAVLRRAAPYYLAACVFLAGYLGLACVLLPSGSVQTADDVLVSALLGLGMLFVVAPLEPWLHKLTAWVSHGGGVNYIGVMERLAESLSTTLDRETLTRLLTSDLVSAMRLSGSALFVKDQDGRLSLLEDSGLGLAGSADRHLMPSGPLTAHLSAAARPVSDADLRRALAGADLTAGERALLSLNGLAFWLPLVSGGAMQGLLVVGDRIGGDYLTAEDERILTTLSHQAGIAVHNVLLTDQLRVAREEMARAHRESLAAVERERQQLAYELHDGAIHQLTVISSRLAGDQAAPGSVPSAPQGDDRERSELLARVQRDLLDVIVQLRRLLADLRPPGLSELGLAAALRRYVDGLQRERRGQPPQITADVPEAQKVLPEPVRIVLFRVAQEALRNALKHSGARHVTLGLRFLEGEAVLTVSDDGCGFRVPDRISELAWSGHLGLIGMTERIAQVGGLLTVCSQPGSGTEVTARIPLSPHQSKGPAQPGEGELTNRERELLPN